MVLTAALLMVAIPKAFAMHEVIVVTKATQIKMGVKFTLTAQRVSDTAIIVRMEIPKEGKLKELKRVTLDIGDYKPGAPSSPWVSVDLHTSPGKNGSLIVSFQLSPEMADKCSIDLGPLDPAIPESLVYYSVQFKGYITKRK